MALVTASDTAVRTSSSSSSEGLSGSRKALTAARAKAVFSSTARKSIRISLIFFSISLLLQLL